MSIDSPHALRVEIARLTKERDELKLQVESKHNALIALREQCDAAEKDRQYEVKWHNETRESLAAANARADAAEALAEDRRKARATVAAMYEAVREAELRPPLATYLEMRREGPNAPLQYYAMKPEKVTGFYGALRERWNGTDVERWTKEFVEARDRVSASESALAAARREVEAHKEALSDLMKLINEGALVRNIGQDGEPGWTLRAMRLVMALKHAYALVPELAAPAPTPGEETRTGSEQTMCPHGRGSNESCQFCSVTGEFE